ncbi:hypothetical protein AB833_22730 [Chromatiales bacterium (ex Bugula neritina AB1)]|nr:hypothetical protein AB833_22730 [Chromatiales bacterium (ex Bugula neritina AB1)]
MNGGLAVGFVVNREGSPSLKAYERHLYTDQLASYILGNNPQLKGKLDSYGYVSARIGKPFSSFINSFKMEGELSRRSVEQLKEAQLRRRFLMLVTILPVDEEIQLPVEVEGVGGLINPEIEDYEDVRYQTGRLKVVHVQVYDTKTGSKVQDQLYSSDDGNILLATERHGRRYTGNSLMGALANSVSNRISKSGNNHPPAPSETVTLNYIWERIAKSVPGATRS